MLLTAAANAGISQRYGEQPNPIHYGHGGGTACVEALQQAGVDTDFAAAVIFAYASKLSLDRPPRSLKYFTDYVIDRWRSEQAKRDAAAFTPGTAPAAPEVDQLRTFAIRYAQSGDASWQQYCDERSIEWRGAA